LEGLHQFVKPVHIEPAKRHVNMQSKKLHKPHQAMITIPVNRRCRNNRGPRHTRFVSWNHHGKVPSQIQAAGTYR